MVQNCCLPDFLELVLFLKFSTNIDSSEEYYSYEYQYFQVFIKVTGARQNHCLVV